MISNSIYVMASKQMVAMRDLETIANNVANVNTTGFRANSLDFESSVYDDKNSKLHMPRISSSRVNFEEGALKLTNNPLDVAISGKGLFMVRTPQGDRYTKAGNFRINNEGTLINPDGHSVLTSDGQEIVFDLADQSPVIGEDGTIFVGDQERGKIGVFEFADLKSLKKTGNTLFSASTAPVEAQGSRVVQGSLEESNVNSVQQIAMLAELQREVGATSNFINETYALSRNAFKVYARQGG